MKLREIQNQLRQYLPLFSERFNDWMDASYSVVGNIATITTVDPHGLEAGNLITLRDVVFPNPLTTLESVDGTAKAVTQIQHDLTQDFQSEIQIQGAVEPELDGVFTKDIEIANNRNVFYFAVEPCFTGTATGSPVLLEKDIARYNGAFNVVNVPDDNTYTIEINGEFDFTSDCQSANTACRIGVAYGVEDAVNYYTNTKQEDFWAFIIPNATTVSKDRDANIDFNKANNNDDYKQVIEESITIMCMGKANREFTPIDIMDEMRIDIRNALLKSIGNLQPEQTNCSKYYKVSYDGDESSLYDDALYSHIYNFTCVLLLRNGDLFVPQSAATRKWTADYKDNDTNNQLTIALDTKEYKEI